jgi:large conductance mechanosensitive channel
MDRKARIQRESSGIPEFYNPNQGLAEVLNLEEELIMGMMKEFKEFAVKGNVIDMAVGIIIGAAFGKIVSSFVGDVIMPPIGVLIGGIDFTNLALTIKQASGDIPAVVISYGKFIQTVVDFAIVAFAIFIAVKGINSLKRKKEEEPQAPPAPPAQEVLLGEIRDLLKARS